MPPSAVPSVPPSAAPSAVPQAVAVASLAVPAVAPVAAWVVLHPEPQMKCMVAQPILVDLCLPDRTSFLLPK